MDCSSILFSIIIPTYNRARIIEQTLKAVLSQSYNNFEVIVVDDGSTDDTATVVSSFVDERIKYCRQANGERGTARNYGTRLAIGQYVNFFDSDDCMYSNHLETALRIIQKYHCPEVFHVAYEMRTPEGNIVKKVNQFGGEVADSLIISNDLACNSVFVRRDIALQHPFCEERTLASAEDWELWLRLASRYPFYYTNVITYALICHPQRSLNQISVDKIIKRDIFLIQVLLQDQYFTKKYENRLAFFVSNRYTFITLNLALSKERRWQTLYFLLKAIQADWTVIGRKRFLASIKHWF